MWHATRTDTGEEYKTLTDTQVTKLMTNGGTRETSFVWRGIQEIHGFSRRTRRHVVTLTWKDEK